MICLSLVGKIEACTAAHSEVPFRFSSKCSELTFSFCAVGRATRQPQLRTEAMVAKLGELCALSPPSFSTLVTSDESGGLYDPQRAATQTVERLGTTSPSPNTATGLWTEPCSPQVHMESLESWRPNPQDWRCHEKPWKIRKQSRHSMGEKPALLRPWSRTSGPRKNFCHWGHLADDIFMIEQKSHRAFQA